MIRRLNEIIHTLLTHASLPHSFWVEAFHTAVYLHNILPTKRLNFATPTFSLYGHHPTYDHLRTFRCMCYPNTSATQSHKLQPRSIKCVFLGYLENFRGYRCFDLATGKVYLSRHVTFDETSFPFAQSRSSSSYEFLDGLPIPSFSYLPSKTQPTPPQTLNQHSSPTVPFSPLPS